MEAVIAALGIISALVGLYVWKQKQKKRTTAGDIIAAVEAKRRARDSMEGADRRSLDTARRSSNLDVLLKTRKRPAKL